MPGPRPELPWLTQADEHWLQTDYSPHVGKIGGIEHLMVVGSMREGDEYRRLSQGRDFSNRSCTSPADQKIGPAVQLGHVIEKRLHCALDMVPAVCFIDLLFIRSAGLMDKMQPLFIFEMSQGFYDRHIYSVGPLTSADDQDGKGPAAGILPFFLGMTMGIF